MPNPVIADRKKFSADFGVEGKSGNMEQILIPPIKNIKEKP